MVHTSPKASIQLIVFGKRLPKDIAGVLRDVAKAGYAAFEAGNLFEAYGEEKTRELLATTGLRVSGAHFGYGDYADPNKLNDHIEYARAVGLTHFMCSGVADGGSMAGYKESAEVFNAAGRRLADAGLSFNYHNHDWEFKDLGGVNGMDILTQETDPAFVKFNIDVFWIHYAGGDPAEFIRQHSDRTGYFHFKDGRRVTDTGGKTQPEFTELGRGEVDLKSAYAAVTEVGAKWVVSEQDNTKLAPEESATISRVYMRDVLGIV